jgi:hypothetical protein
MLLGYLYTSIPLDVKDKVIPSFLTVHAVRCYGSKMIFSYLGLALSLISDPDPDPDLDLTYFQQSRLDAQLYLYLF